MGSFADWFDKYGRPEPTMADHRLYTYWEKKNGRCCGEPSQVQVMKKGSLTR